MSWSRRMALRIPLSVILVFGASLWASAAAAVDAPPTTIGSIDVDAATIPELQAAMASGDLSSEALVQLYLDRIEALDPHLNAVISLNPAALEEAQAADEARAAGTDLPLLGIPVILKDNINTTGMPTTAGSLALAESMPPDAFIVSRLRDAGAVILGKANLSEWANMRGYPSSSGWSALGGQASTPYALDRNPCGSSWGSAIAVAASLATVAVGTETDGSILCPASVNGIVAVKPSLGLVSRSGIVPISMQQDTAGPMARNVTDAAILLGVLAAEDAADPMTAEGAGAAADYAASLDANALEGARIGVWREGTFGIDPRVDAVIEDAIDQLEGLGAEIVDPADLSLEGLGDAEWAAMTSEFKHDIGSYLETLDPSTPKTLQDLIDFNNEHADVELALFGQETFEAAQAAPDISDPAYLEARETATRIARTALDETLAAHDLDAILVSSGDIAWVHAPSDPEPYIYTWGPAAVAGYPSITVPAGHVSGLPVGMSFIGPRFGEADLLGLAYAWEQATNVRVPPTFPDSVEVPEPEPVAEPGEGASASAAPEASGG